MGELDLMGGEKFTKQPNYRSRCCQKVYETEEEAVGTI